MLDSCDSSIMIRSYGNQAFVKSPHQNTFWLTADVLVKRSKALSDPGSFKYYIRRSVAINSQNLLAVSQNTLESYDSTIVLRSKLSYSRKYPHPSYGRHRIGYQKISGFQRRTVAVYAGFQTLLIQNLEEFQNFARL